MIKNRKLTLIQYQLIESLYSDITNCPINNLFLVQNPIRVSTLHLVFMPPQSLSIWDSFVLFCFVVFVVLTILKTTGQLLCGISHNLGLWYDKKICLVLEINPPGCGQLIQDKEGKNMQWRKTVSSISGAGKTGQLHVKQ